MIFWRLACRLFGHPMDVRHDLCVRCWQTGYAIHSRSQRTEEA